MSQEFSPARAVEDLKATAHDLVEWGTRRNQVPWVLVATLLVGVVALLAYLILEVGKVRSDLRRRL